jgi:hypothetical protein
MKKLLQIVLVSSLSLLCFSCYYDEIEGDLLIIEIPDIPDIPDDPTDPNYVEILFQTDIQPIFTANCINCHNANRDPDLRDGNAYSALLAGYVNADNADTSLLYTKLAVDGHQNVSTADLTLIKGWINQGANNN